MNFQEIKQQIQSVIQNNPEMNNWPKHKKKYLELKLKHGIAYSLKNCKPEDREFLIFFSSLQVVRNKIKLLKDLKEHLQGGGQKRPNNRSFSQNRHHDQARAFPKQGQQGQFTQAKNQNKDTGKRRHYHNESFPDRGNMPHKNKEFQNQKASSSIKQSYSAGFFRNEVQAGIWAKKR